MSLASIALTPVGQALDSAKQLKSLPQTPEHPNQPHCGHWQLETLLQGLLLMKSTLQPTSQTLSLCLPQNTQEEH